MVETDVMWSVEKIEGEFNRLCSLEGEIEGATKEELLEEFARLINEYFESNNEMDLSFRIEQKENI